MTIVFTRPTEAEVKREISAMRATSKRILRSKKTAREYLVKNGFITKDGKLHPRYR